MSNAGHHHSHKHHHHGHHHGHHHDGSTASIFKVFCLNLGFSILELAGGLFTGSVALIADALHDFGDALVIASAYFFQKKSESAPDPQFTYGYQRYSLLSAMITGVVLLVGSVSVIVFAIGRFSEPPSDLKTLPMVVFAFIGLAVNGFSFLQMKNADGGHNAKMIRWHLLEDTAGWAAVLLGAVIMHFTAWYWIDATLAIAIAVWILVGVGRSLWATLQLLLQKVPPEFNLNEIEQKISEVVGVKDVHDLHLWSLDGSRHVLSMHVIRESSQVKLSDLKVNIREKISSFGEIHSTIEVEDPEEDCHDYCD